MSLFDKLFGKTPKVALEQCFKLLNGYTPVFTTWNGAVYESELARAAIDARARHVSKLGVEIIGAAKPALRRKLEKRPNDWQSWSQFFYRVSTILDCNNNCFILPIIGEYDETTGYYPVVPMNYSIMTSKTKEVYLRVQFQDGQWAAIELNRCLILTKFQYESDFFGSSNRALAPTMDLINIQNKGIEEAVKNSASFRFMAMMNNFATDQDIAKEKERFANTNLKSKGGFLIIPNIFKDVKQINSTPYTCDDKQMALIRTNVYNYFGVNEDILQNKAYGDAWNAFYEGAIEPFAIQFSEAMTKATYSDKEQSEGNKIIATSNRLQYMSNADKLNVSSQLLDRGIMSINDVRQIWNLPTVDGGDKRIIRGEYYNATEKLQGDTNED